MCRWLPILACALVFLFAFHAKTAVYREGLRGKPQTNTASKLWAASKIIVRRPTSTRVLSSVAQKNLTDLQIPFFGRIAQPSKAKVDFAHAPRFSGLSPPAISWEAT